MVSGNIELSWSPSVDAESGIWYYTVYRNGAFHGAVDATATTLTDYRVRPGPNYTYSVNATDNEYNTSPMSASTSITIPGGAPAPTLTQVSPSSAEAGSPPLGWTFWLTVYGTGFMPDSVVQWNGGALETTWVNCTFLAAKVPRENLASPRTAQITVFTPAPGGGTSNSMPFTVGTNTTPVPTVTGLSPASITAGWGDFTLTVNGAGFIVGSSVQWNGNGRGTNYVNSTQLTATIYSSDVANAGSAQVAVYTPPPGGGTSSPLTFTITAPANNPVPSISSLSPASVAPGSAAFTLTVTGNNFVAGSVIRWNGSDRTTTFVSSTQLTAAIVAADVAVAGTAAVTVVNPAPGGGASNSASFPITASGFTLSTLPAQYLIAGAGDPVLATVTVTPIGGFNQNVTFSVTNAPAGISVSFDPASVAANGSTTISFGAAAETAPGTYRVRLNLVAPGLPPEEPEITVVVIDVTLWYGQWLTPLDDGTVYAFNETYITGLNADLCSSRIAAASYTSPSGQSSGSRSGNWQYGPVPAAVRFPAFSLPLSGFGTYSFSMQVQFCVLAWCNMPEFGSSHPYPTPNISSLSPNSSQRGGLVDVAVAGTGLGAADEGLAVYKGVGSINVSSPDPAHPLTGSLQAPQAAQPQRFPDMTGNNALATLDATSAAPGTYQISLTVFGYTTNSLPFYVGDVTPYIAAVTDVTGNPIWSIPAGTQTYVIVWGSGFGPLPGGVAICSYGANPCSSSDVSAQIAYWSPGQINLLLTTSPASQGAYDIQVTSSGATGSGFLSIPGGSNSAQSNRAQLAVGGTQLALLRPSLTQVQASAIPAGGQFTQAVSLLAGSDTASIDPNVTTTTSGNIQTTTFMLVDPPNPARDGSPSPGGLAEIAVTYTPPSGPAASKKFTVPTFGMSCYYTTLESDWGSPPGSCGTIRYPDGTWSGSVTNPYPDLQGTYCSAFVGSVKWQGSGIPNSGRAVQWIGGAVKRVDQINARDGTPPVANQTVARDRAYQRIIPSTGVHLALNGVGTNLLANDTGAADYIVGYRLDLYKGVGRAVCNGYSNPIVIAACSPGSATCPSQ